MTSARKDRIDLIDALRGFALLGILAVHFMEQYLGNLPPVEFESYTRHNPVDMVLEVLGFLLIRGKGFALFSFMFGLSFALQMQRAEIRNPGGDFRPRFVWRLLLLFLIGCLHGTLYRGDILRLYGLLGIPLIAFYRVPNRWLWAIALALFLGGPRIVMYFAASPSTPADLQAQQAEVQAQAEEHWQLLKNGPTHTMLQRNATQGFGSLLEFQFGSLARGYQTFGYFLIGLWAGRLRLLSEPTLHRTLFKRTLKWSVLLTVGLPILAGVVWAVARGVSGGASVDGDSGASEGAATSMPDLTSWPVVAGLTLYDLWNLVMTLGVIAAFVLLAQRPRWQRLLLAFAPVGRMALSSYVMQSVAGALVFTHLGFGLLGEIGNSWTLPLGLALFGLQMALSRWWLDHYFYGPLEWLWRSLTWFKRQPFRRMSPIPS